MKKALAATALLSPGVYAPKPQIRVENKDPHLEDHVLRMTQDIQEGLRPHVENVMQNVGTLYVDNEWKKLGKDFIQSEERDGFVQNKLGEFSKGVENVIKPHVRKAVGEFGQAYAANQWGKFTGAVKPSVRTDKPKKHMENYLFDATEKELKYTYEEILDAWNEESEGGPRPLHSRFTSVGQYLMKRFYDLQATGENLVSQAILEYVQKEIIQKVDPKILWKRLSPQLASETGPSFKSTLEDFKDAVITGVFVTRTPLAKFVSNLVPELGGEAYHASITLETSKGFVKIEKAPALRMERVASIEEPNSEQLDLTDAFFRAAAYPTVADFVQGTLLVLGEQFYKYDSVDPRGNCQGFVLGGLDAIGVLDELATEEVEFFLQDLSKVPESKRHLFTQGANVKKAIQNAFDYATTPMDEYQITSPPSGPYYGGLKRVTKKNKKVQVKRSNRVFDEKVRSKTQCRKRY